MWEKYKTILEKNEINNHLRLAHFMAQIHHESNLKPVAENFNYSSSRLMVVFGKYFTPELADFYNRKPEMIANRVYADRMGNGGERSGDGWKYRGRGFIQITGKSNYKDISDDLSIDYLNNPDLLLNEADAMISAVWYWNRKNVNDLADDDDIVAVTKAINGGLNGIKHRKELLLHYKNIIK